MNKRKIGQEWEKVAARYLVNKGYKILYLNWTSRWAEIDIVAKKDGTFTFVEVKFGSGGMGHPSSAVHYYKRRAQKRAMQLFLKEHEMDELNTKLRFDVVTISAQSAQESKTTKSRSSQQPRFRIQHFENVPLD